jgi:nitrogen regulatory protein PII
MENKNLRLLTAVVQRSHGDRVVDAALKAGATGVTFFYAQGSGVRQRLGVFGHLIEAEKEVIFIVTTAAQIDQVMKAVAEAGELNKAAYGFAYVQEVLDAVGFVQPSTAVE